MKTYLRFWAHERSYPCSAHTQFLSHFRALTEFMKTDFVPFKPRVPRKENWCSGFFVPSPHTSNSATSERDCN